VKRIEQVRHLKATQFVEDAGSTSHPVRPDSYIEISNFYTPTIYEKGAEVIRMMYNLLGKDKYYQGIKLYFRRHDGQVDTFKFALFLLITLPFCAGCDSG
jgi:aminopeptidase N